MKSIIHPDYSYLKEFLMDLPLIFENEGESIYKGRNAVKKFKANGLSLVVKRYKKPILINQLVYSFIRPSKACRAYVYAQKVIAKDFNTPAPIAYIENKKYGLLKDSYFVSLFCDYPNMMKEFWDENIIGKEHILKEFGKFSARLHENEIYHKDYSPGNIFYKEEGLKAKFCIIDINRMHFGPVSFDKGCKNFIRLWGSDEAFRIFATEYALERGFDIQETIARIFAYRKQFQKQFNRKQALKQFFKKNL